MKTYEILPAHGSLPALERARFYPVDGLWAQIDDYPWGGYYAPDARANVVHDESGLWVTMFAKEETVSAHETQFGGAVCRDSCLEFFFNPAPEKQDKYINIETNPRGTMHIGVGAGRQNRTVLSVMPEMRLSRTGHTGGAWAIRYYVPFALMKELTGFEHEAVMKGNFYKCDETIHPHFGTWAPVSAPMPDFHRPEYFGELILK